MNRDKIEILKAWTKPESLTDIKSFVGLVQFFRRLIRKFFEVAASLTNVTKKNIGIEKWDEKCDTASNRDRNAFSEASILVAPDWKQTVSRTC